MLRLLASFTLLPVAGGTSPVFVMPVAAVPWTVCLFNIGLTSIAGYFVQTYALARREMLLVELAGERRATGSRF